MELYHIDFFDKLSGCEEFIQPITNYSEFNQSSRDFCKEKFPKGISYFGYENMKPFNPEDSYITACAKIKEIFLEYIRQIEAPERPSRFQCIFAVRTCEEVKTWFCTLKKCYFVEKEQPKQVYVYVLEVSEDLCFEADSYFRDAFDYPYEKSFNVACEYFKGRNYWSGKIAKTFHCSAPEILVPLPVKVVEKLPYEEFVLNYCKHLKKNKDALQKKL